MAKLGEFLDSKMNGDLINSILIFTLFIFIQRYE